MKRVAVSILFLIAVAACAGPAGVSPGGGLMYQVPDPATVVKGAALVHITFQGKNERVVEVAQDGMQATQTVSGDLDGTLLWDPARSLMVRFEEDFEMDGMYEIVGAPIPPMPLDVRGRSRIMLQGG